MNAAGNQDGWGMGLGVRKTFVSIVPPISNSSGFSLSGRRVPHLRARKGRRSSGARGQRQISRGGEIYCLTAQGGVPTVRTWKFSFNPTKKRSWPRLPLEAGLTPVNSCTEFLAVTWRTKLPVNVAGAPVNQSSAPSYRQLPCFPAADSHLQCNLPGIAPHLMDSASKS